MKKQLMIATMASSMALAGCATGQNMGATGQNNMGTTTYPATTYPAANQNWQKSAIGALAGAALGAGISKASGGDETGRDAAIGALIGGGVGYYMQQQANALQQQMAGTGVEVSLDPNTNKIDIVMPSNITFDTNKFNVKSGFSGTLTQLSSTLGQYNKTKVIVKGHTDSTGGDEHNQNLSEKRAYSVASYLNNNGVAANRISTIGYGETRPVATNTTQAGKSQNRRVEIEVSAPEKLS